MKIVERLRTLYPKQPVVMQAARKIEQQALVLAEIAESPKRDWFDPAEHANWCVEQAQHIIGD